MRKYDDQYIVVTGGAGFIGSGVVGFLNQLGLKNILIADNLGTSEKWKNLVGKSFSDLIHKDQLFEWLNGRESEVGAFIHLGACSSTVETDANYFLENNYRYSIRLAEYALKYGQRFIYASSAATYGDGSLGFLDSHDSIEELRPLNMYGFSKQLFDLWIKKQGVLDRVVGLKYFNVFGPNEYHKGRMASVIYHVLPIAQKEGVIRLFKSTDPENFPDGGQMRDFIYVKDAVRMTCQFLENESCGLFNIGRGIPGTWNEIASSVFKGINMPVNISYIDMPKDLLGKYQNYTCADMQKTAQALKGNIECTPLESAVVEYVQKYLISCSRW